jgi:hypothetical protein
MLRSRKVAELRDSARSITATGNNHTLSRYYDEISKQAYLIIGKRYWQSDLKLKHPRLRPRRFVYNITTHIVVIIDRVRFLSTSFFKSWRSTNGTVSRKNSKMPKAR